MHSSMIDSQYNWIRLAINDLDFTNQYMIQVPRHLRVYDYMYDSLFICTQEKSRRSSLTLATKYFNTISDVDECTLHNSGCSQICTNTFGSYVCSCRTGFRLATNGRSCEGILTYVKLNTACMFLSALGLTHEFYCFMGTPGKNSGSVASYVDIKVKHSACMRVASVGVTSLYKPCSTTYNWLAHNHMHAKTSKSCLIIWPP